MNGISYPKTASKAFQTSWSLAWWEALLLFGSGVLAVMLHRSFDYSLGLPGHHGIEWIALLIIGRASSRFRGAGIVTSLGASFASLVPFWRGGDPFIPFLYLLPGPVLDFAFHYFPRYSEKVWFLALLGGLAHMTKPLARLIITLVSGWPFGSFRFGIAYPFAGHILFGMIGGLLGALIMLGIQRSVKKSSQ